MRVSRVGSFVPGIVALLSLLVAAAGPLQAQQTILMGTVRNENGEPVVAADVRIQGTPAPTGAVTNAQGVYRVSVPAGTYDVVVEALGHAARRIEDVAVAAGQTTTVDVMIPTHAVALDPLVVSVGRGLAERQTETVATVHSVSALEIAERPAPSLSDHLVTAPGVDVISQGLQSTNVVVRGFNNIFSGALHMLTDYRLAGVPSLRVNLMHFIPSNEEDVERMEVVLGPGSALYGPNTANGVVHILTKSPLDSAGTTVTIGGGEQSAFLGSFRSAWRLSDQFGFKASGQYLSGDEWPYLDPAEDSARAVAVDPTRMVQGVQACIFDKAVRGYGAADAAEACGRVGRRDFDIERWGGELRADWRFAEDGSVIATYGRTSATGIELTGLGAGQTNDWVYEFYQLRGNKGRLFAQAYVNTSDAGDTYLLRDGTGLTDESKLWVGQIQHGIGLADGRYDFTYGFDYFGTRPETDGSINGAYEDADDMDEWGVYLQAKTRVTDQLDLILAGRMDDHSILEDQVWSPRAGLVYRPVPTHSFRLSYNRAFSTPSSLNYFLDVSGGMAPTIGPLGYGVRAYGTGPDGWSLQPGGVTQIRSPFINPGGQYPIVPPPSPGQLWPAAVGIIQAQGVIDADQASILGPLMPTSADIDWMLTDPNTRIPEPLATKVLPDVPSLQESYTESVELGWTGLFGNRLQVTADAYWQKKSDFVSPLLLQTPLLMLNGPDVGDFIGVPYVTARTGQLFAQGGMTLAEAQAQATAEVVPIATALASAPLGVVASPEVLGSTRPELIVTYRNVGDIELWGADLALEWFVTDDWSLSGTASWVSDDYFRPEGTAPVSLNAPEFKGSVSAAYRNAGSGFSGGWRVRFQSAFPAESAGYVGTLCIPDQPVGLFTEDCVERAAIVDVNLAYRIPSTDATVQLVVNNVFDSDYRSFVGVPNIGRFAMVSMRYELF